MTSANNDYHNQALLYSAILHFIMLMLAIFGLPEIWRQHRESLPVAMSVSFGFMTFEGMARGMAAAAREGIVADNFGLNPRLQKAWLGRTNMKQSTSAALAVFLGGLDYLFQFILNTFLLS